MSHTLYSTSAIVLKRVETGEADTTLWLLTEALGLIVARAQSARKEEAKMRAHLQTYNCLKATLVRGKYIWRITGTEEVSTGTASNPTQLQGSALSAFARVCNFVRRMALTDEAGTSDLFGIVHRARQALISTPDDLEYVELCAVAETLVSLGYISKVVLEQLKMATISKRELAHVVNKAIQESHL